MAGNLANIGFDILPYDETMAAASFDADTWRSALLAANPWARRTLKPGSPNWNPQGGHAYSAAFIAARKTACLARWREGTRSWNLWAAEMLRLRTTLERAGFWRTQTLFPLIDGASAARQQGDNAFSAAWLALSFVDFSKTRIHGDASFDQLVFPGDLIFRGAEFQAGAGFQQASFAGSTDFSGATFAGDARFRSVHFRGPAAFHKTVFGSQAAFHNATFTGAADFHLAKFSGRATFKRVKFHHGAEFQGAAFRGWAAIRDAQFAGTANFESAAFRAPADFNRTRFRDGALFRHARFLAWSDFQDSCFEGDAIFQNSRFSSWADFNSTRFNGWTVFQNARFTAQADFQNASFANATDFQRADFTGSTVFQNVEFAGWAGFGRVLFGNTVSFRNARFQHEAEFTSARCASNARVELADAVFQETPNFHLAQLSEAPQPQNIGVQSPHLRDAPGAWLRALLRVNQDPLTPLKWRSLKQFAFQIGDAELERVFHIRELRSRRWLTDQPFPWFWRDPQGVPRFGWPHGVRFWSGVLQQLAANLEQNVPSWLSAQSVWHLKRTSLEATAINLASGKRQH